MVGGGAPVFDMNSNVPSVKPKTVRQTLPAIGIAAFAAFGGILFGYDTGTISGILVSPYFLQQFGNAVDPTTNLPMLTTGRESLVVSILSAGTFTGALAGAPISDILGRRWGLQVAMVVFCLGVILQIAATGSTYGMFVAGRVIAGGGVGIVSTIIPMYQSEVAPRWIRGAVVSGYQWAITIGLLIAAIVNNSTQSRPDSGAYRIPIAIQLAFAIILSIGMFILPESPRWYMKVGKTEQAAKALARLNSTDMDDPVVRAEMADIQTNLDVERMHSSGSYMDCFRPNERKNLTRTLVGTSLQGFQQLTGINFIFYYGTTFFKSINAGNPYIFTIASNVVNVVCTIPGMYGMERVGRRKMLIFGAAWMCVMEFMIAIIGTVEPTSNTPAQTSLVALVCLYVAAFASTWGPAAWVVCGEIFPLQIRAKALSLCTASNWLWNFGIGYATPYLVNTGPGEAGLGPKVFFVWGGTCLLCTLFAYFFIIETKGLSLEEVDELYANTTPIKSAAANREVKARRTDLENASKFAGPRDDEEVMADLAKNDVIKSGTHDVDEKNSL